MSEENVELVHRANEAWNTGGVEAIIQFWTEDCIWWPFPESPFPTTGMHGHEGIREVMAGWTDSFDDWTVSIREIKDLGDRVLTLNEMSGTVKGTDAKIKQPMASVAWDFRDGKAGRARFFSSWEEAEDAAAEPLSSLG